MKVSQQKKQETKRTLVNTAVELFVLQGYKHTSLKQIAREAGVGDATIYKYFSTKDKLILGFYQVRGEEALEVYRNTEDLESYELGERLQLIVDTYLEQLGKDREFVELSLELFADSPISLFKHDMNIADAYRREFLQMFDEISDDEDFPEIPFRQTLAVLFVDFLFGITYCWMKDESEDYADTTKLVELSIALFESFLRSNIASKASDIVVFLIKSQLSRLATSSGNMMPLMKVFMAAMKDRKSDIF